MTERTISIEEARRRAAPQDQAPASRRNIDPLSDDALAMRFTNRHGDDLRYVAPWGRWMMWNGQRWHVDSTLDVFDKARAICREGADACDKDSDARRVANAQTVAAVERLARADRQHAATVDQWDADPWLLNTPGGVVDLQTGRMREHRRIDHMTKMTAVAPDFDAKCPRWRAFLHEVTGGDGDLQAFLQRMCGYALTGSTREHALFFAHGTGRNGKSTFFNTVAAIASDYATTASMETFVASQSDRHPTDLASLRGARIVTAQETEEGRAWAESRIKALTGGDPISARFMRMDFFEYVPQFKLLISGNHKPGLRNVDEAMRRRLHLIPFTVRVPDSEVDERLPDKLEAEAPAILAWMIHGAAQWANDGLQPPECVRAATDSYLAAEDAVRAWIGDCCTTGSHQWDTSANLWASWKRWASQNGEREGSRKRFGQALEDRGYAAEKSQGVRGYQGLKANTNEHATPYDD